MAWVLRAISPEVEIAAFDCGEESLNKFLSRHALNNHRAGLGRTYVATDERDLIAMGYFTLSGSSVRFDLIPDHIKKRLPKFPIPLAHLGRLAVGIPFQGQGLGEGLLIEAIRKVVMASRNVGVYGVDVLALHEKAKTFYAKYGFVEMLDQPLHLFLPINTARQLTGMLDE